jgi:pyruvate,water dikinase
MARVRTLDDPASGDDEGGKAAGLRAACAAGLLVPPTLIVPPGELPSDLEARAAALGEPLIVRSSASIEDRASGGAPGIFLSIRDVTAPGLRAAIEAVRASVDTPAARAILAGRAARMTVLVEPQLAGRAGTLYTRAPGGEDRMLVESGRVEAFLARDDRVEGPAIAPGLLELGLAAERALGGPADVEWVLADGRLVVVQLRPIVAGPALPRDDELEAALAFSRAEPDVVWTRDAVHNPDPLTPAQAGLVALVDAARAAPLRQRVVLGHLYYVRTGEPRRADWAGEIVPALERALFVLDQPDADLIEVLDAYVAFYRIYAGCAPPPTSGGVPTARLHEAARQLAPAWDVGAPTFGEIPGLVESLPPPAPAPPNAAPAEEDDLYFSRAQAGVRRALARVALLWGVALDDLVYLPLEEVARSSEPPPDLAARAATARAERGHQASRAMPARIVAGRPIYAASAVVGDVVRGRGTGGQATGRVHRFDPDRPRPVEPGAILVVATILPTLAPLLGQVAGIVAEHGGLLGHGAALARQLGVPYVVGAVGARQILREGDRVWMDGAAGLIARLSA